MHLTLELLWFVEWKCGVGVVAVAVVAAVVGSVMREFDAVGADSK